MPVLTLECRKAPLLPDLKAKESAASIHIVHFTEQMQFYQQSVFRLQAMCFASNLQCYVRKCVVVVKVKIMLLYLDLRSYSRISDKFLRTNE